MPLIKGAKPGSSGFKENIRREVEAGKPVKQAVAIAYSESGEHQRKQMPKSVVKNGGGDYGR